MEGTKEEVDTKLFAEVFRVGRSKYRIVGPGWKVEGELCDKNNY